jgi:ABC-type uncharacterized transport system permease subunit
MSMLSRISILCFAGSYAVVLALELTRLLFRSGVRGAIMLGFAGAGLFAHTVYLVYRTVESYQAAGSVGSPLSSKQEWYLIAAWLLAVVYLYLTCYHPRVPFGLFILPLVLGLIAVAAFAADPRPLAREPASMAWGLVHGISILLATVAVMVGFAAGLMFLGQDRRLKTKAPPGPGLRLPSLERLQQINSQTLVIALIMMGLGIASGIVLNLINRGQGERPLVWNDPVIVSSLLMFGWLMLSSGIGVVYRPVREGRKVAYLTVVSFVFLAIALWSVLSNGTRHLGRTAQGIAPAVQQGGRIGNSSSRPAQAIAPAGPGQTVTVRTPARGGRA